MSGRDSQPLHGSTDHQLGLTAVDLFAGLGGFTEGARQAGIKVVWAGNHWRLAVDWHRTNHPEVEHVCQDLQQADWSAVPAHDLLLASPACQGHSKARGKDRPHHDATRSTAWAAGQFGLERTWIRHVARMRGVFRLVCELLADDGLQFQHEPPRVLTRFETVLGIDPHGVSRRLATPARRAALLALGNSLVPQIPEIIGRAIMKELAK